jgi:hypothetical protein
MTVWCALIIAVCMLRRSDEAARNGSGRMSKKGQRPPGESETIRR